jgi:hypothetical protein
MAKRSKTARRPSAFQAGKEVRRLARERVGAVPAGRVIEPKRRRKAPKHPRKEWESWLEV